MRSPVPRARRFDPAATGGSDPAEPVVADGAAGPCAGATKSVDDVGPGAGSLAGVRAGSASASTLIEHPDAAPVDQRASASAAVEDLALALPPGLSVVTLRGGTGNDTLSAASGCDVVLGGAGRDAINVATAGPPARVSCGMGRDTVRANRNERRRVRGCEVRRVLRD